MKFSIRLLFSFVLFILFLTPQKLYAQSQSAVSASYTVWGGYSFNSVRFLGKTTNSQTQIFGLGLQRPLKKYAGNKVIWYTADFVPYIHYRYPKRDENNRMVSRSGFGLSPVGFLLTNSSQNRLTPFIRTSGGLIYMKSNFPTDLARRLNFTFDITLGGNYHFNSFGKISFGYKFHHISNAETGKQNPGLDSNFLFLKFSFQ